ncbi:DUF92 domain-containing protein [Tuberibacillus sp. Marseille-P3662]|uniref:DUF92 domain-containing protein n=1 Tax=Tuberibacillus sp. Marseille-P3662 TaxID=1965358 RepID=UPI000A1CBBB1|nr:DUF92 domain-containing protein [Tuberibacillus sp. Marseille-P3662]
MVNSLAVVALLLAAWFSLKKQVLTRSAGVAMVIMGSVITFSLGIGALILMFLFFSTSSMLTGRSNRESSQTRSLIQVLANGGIPMLAAMGNWIVPHSVWFIIYIACIGAANSDTWASEWGKRSSKLPYHWQLGRRVTVGLSGAISLSGTIASLLGALFIVCCGVLILPIFPKPTFIWIILLTLTAWLGQWVDTWLGGFCQGRFRCSECGCLTDHDTHCHQPAVLVHGYGWMTNSMVNSLASFSSGIAGGGIYLWFLSMNWVPPF